jgi:DNA (cytosine-5)-methyltransferase 1
LLNARHFGLPQNRERLFIIATKLKPIDFSKLKYTPTPKLRDFLDKEGDFEILDKSEYTLIDLPKKQESELIFVGYRNKGIWKTGVRPNTEHLSRVHRQPNRIYSVDGVHPTLPSQETSGRFFIYIPENNLVRKLTIQECYRIMGFPDNFKKANSLAECYKQIGNSVCIPLVEAIAKELLKQKLFSEDNFYESPRKAQEPIQLILFN